VKDQITLMNDELDRLQKEVDSPAEYARVSKICQKNGVNLSFRH